MNLKRILSVFVVIALLFAGCSSTGDAGGGGESQSAAPSQAEPAAAGTGEPAQDGAPYRAVYIARTLADPFAAWLSQEMQTQAAGYADVFTLDVLDAQGDNEKSNSLIETAITQKYDCIILQSNDGELQRPYAERAIAAGIKVVAVNPQIPGLEGASQVDADPYEQGKVLAQDAVERVPENGRVVLMSAIPGNLHTTQRYEAYKDIFFAQRTDCELVAEVILERVSEADAMATFEDWVQSYGEIDCVLTSADVLALSCLEVVKGNDNYADMLAYGVDGLAGSMLAIKEGRYTGSCMQNATEIAALSLQAAKEMLTGEKELAEYAVNATLVNASNVDEFIEMYLELGMLKPEEVNG